MEEFNLDEFLSTVYSESKKGEIDNAINIVMDRSERLLGGLFAREFNDGMEHYGGPRILPEDEEVNPRWVKISEVLCAYDPWKADHAIAISFLVMFHRHQEHVPGYKDFAARVRKRLLEEMPPKDVEGIMERLG